MPRRTNRFQRLITFLEQQLAPVGAAVTPSALLQDLAGGVEREVDILVESTVGLHPMRIALECRDHKRRQNVEWIESLAGKREHLPVHKLIAVSSSGFTKTATALAAHHDIVLLTLEHALNTDWLAAIARYRIALFVWDHSLVGFECNYHDGGRLDLTSDDLVHASIEDSAGHRSGEMQDDVMMLYRTFAPREVATWISENAKELLAQPPGFTWDLRLSYSAKGRFLVSPGGERRQLREVVLRLQLSYRTEPGSLEYFQYNNQPVAIGTLRRAGGATAYNVALLLTPDGAPRALNIAIDAPEAIAGE
jgi:hypothetical protein